MVKFSIYLVLIGIVSFLIILFKVNLTNKSLTTLQKLYHLNSLTAYEEGELTTGDSIVGKLRSFEDNLGIISIRFETFNRINDSVFIFRVKEDGKDSWYYENEYQSSKFGGYPLFPFGFPIIADAKDKIYHFELEVLEGRLGNSVAIKIAEPVIATTHKFTADQLLYDKKMLLSFLFQKVADLTFNKPALMETLFVYVILSSVFVALVNKRLLVQLTSKSSKQIRVGKLKHLRSEQAVRVWLSILKVLIFMGNTVLRLLTLPPKWLKKE